MRLTADQIEAGRSSKGGWTRAQLAQWGVPWPPPKGWKDSLISPPFAHPETGELLETKDDFIDAMNSIELRMSPMWIVRRQIRDEFARRFDPYLPARRSRTEKQERVARCPRCGGDIE